VNRFAMNYEGHGFTVRLEIDGERFRVRRTSKLTSVTSSFGAAWEAAELFARWVREVEVGS
jgi:hypothetical protein